MHSDVHRIIVPTLFGYATLVPTRDTTLPTGRGVSTASGGAHLLGGGTRRIDTVVPSDITVEELLDFQAHLLLRPGHRRRPRCWKSANRCSSRTRK